MMAVSVAAGGAIVHGTYHVSFGLDRRTSRLDPFMKNARADDQKDRAPASLWRE
jgi:hypothetical protein